jgi:hypothetical protein
MEIIELHYYPLTQKLYLCGSGILFTEEAFLSARSTHKKIRVRVDLPNLKQHFFSGDSDKISDFSDLFAKVLKGSERILTLYQEIQEKRTEIQKLKSFISTEVKEIDNTASVDWSALVIQEEQWRLSEDIAHESLIDWIEYTGTVIQPKILSNNGIEPTPQNLYRLRAAAQDTQVFWIKYNRAREGDLHIGHPIPQGVALYDSSSDSNLILTHLANRALSTRPLVLLAGSVS